VLLHWATIFSEGQNVLDAPQSPTEALATYPRERWVTVSLPCLHLTGEVARGCVTEGEIRKGIRRSRKRNINEGAR
jgi:hypothetical protein